MGKRVGVKAATAHNLVETGWPCPAMFLLMPMLIMAAPFYWAFQGVRRFTKI